VLIVHPAELVIDQSSLFVMEHGVGPQFLPRKNECHCIMDEHHKAPFAQSSMKLKSLSTERNCLRVVANGQVDVANIADDFGDSLGVIVACVDGQRSERQFKRLGIVFRAVTARVCAALALARGVFIASNISASRSRVSLSLFRSAVFISRTMVSTVMVGAKMVRPQVQMPPLTYVSQPTEQFYHRCMCMYRDKAQGQSTPM